MQAGPSILTVTYPVRPDQQGAFHEWLAKLNQSAAAAKGFLGMGINTRQERPTEIDWTITYKFDTDGERDAWVGSAPRVKAQAEGSGLFTSAPHETLGVVEGRARSLMVVRSHVSPDREADWRVAQARFQAAVLRFPGFDGVDVFKPRIGSDVWTTVLSFRTQEDLRRWEESPERRELLDEVAIARQDDVIATPSAYGQWFSAEATVFANSPTWKQAMLALLVLFPLVTLYDMTLGNAAGEGLKVDGHLVFGGLGLPFPFVVFLGNVVGTILLTWVLMPVVIRGFDWWLNPYATAEQTWRGAVLLVIAYAVEVAAAIFIYQTWGF
jgi:antibiotic biosynthesis monooxygenase (ABM) superfamily enzyme